MVILHKRFIYKYAYMGVEVRKMSEKVSQNVVKHGVEPRPVQADSGQGLYEEVLKEIAPGLFKAYNKKGREMILDTREPTERQLTYLKNLITDFKERYKRFIERKGEMLKTADPKQLEKAMWINEIVKKIEKCINQFNRSTISYAIIFLKQTRWIR